MWEFFFDFECLSTFKLLLSFVVDFEGKSEEFFFDFESLSTFNFIFDFVVEFNGKSNRCSLSDTQNTLMQLVDGCATSAGVGSEVGGEKVRRDKFR